MSKRAISIVSYVLSMFLSGIAYLYPLTSRVAPDGSYIGIDCNPFVIEPKLWFGTTVLMVVGFYVAKSVKGAKAAAKGPMLLAAVLLLTLSVTFKYQEFKKFDAETQSTKECQNGLKDRFGILIQEDFRSKDFPKRDIERRSYFSRATKFDDSGVNIFFEKNPLKPICAFILSMNIDEAATCVVV